MLQLHNYDLQALTQLEERAEELEEDSPHPPVVSREVVTVTVILVLLQLSGQGPVTFYTVTIFKVSLGQFLALW